MGLVIAQIGDADELDSQQVEIVEETRPRKEWFAYRDRSGYIWVKKFINLSNWVEFFKTMRPIEMTREFLATNEEDAETIGIARLA